MAWQSKVYQPKEIQDKWPPKVRTHILERDKECQVCGEKRRRQLTVHHILPRAQGGGENADNLIALCRQCHDEVELAQYKNKSEILGHNPQWPISVKHEQPDKEPVGKNWQAWVYGGARNPQK